MWHHSLGAHQTDVNLKEIHEFLTYLKDDLQSAYAGINKSVDRGMF